jgi:phosphatidylglycerophosphate synthase
MPVTPAIEVVGTCAVDLWGLSSAQRHQRTFARAGWTDGPTRSTRILVRADYVFGADIARALTERPGTALVDTGSGVGHYTVVAVHIAATGASAARELLEREPLAQGAPLPAGLEAHTAAELGSFYNEALRKREPPLLARLSADSRTLVERRTFGAAYKGVTDFVTKWLWPEPAFWATRWAAARGLSPNTVTTASLVLVIVTAFLFAHGAFLPALPFAWAMTFLDTVDGKLARVTMTSSWWGNLYDHGIDLIHPPFWWWAWFAGLHGAGAASGSMQLALWVVIGGYVLGRIVEGLFLHSFGIQTHVWEPVDSRFRAITARRNPNLALLTAASIGGRPDIGFVLVALWTAVCLVFHAVRFAQARALRQRGGTVRSWLSAPASP